VLVQWHAAKGEYDKAFALAGATEGGVPSMMRIDPLFERFRADRRFQGAGPSRPNP
jgi:hypothetical protein